MLAFLAAPLVHQLWRAHADPVADVDRGEAAGVDVVVCGKDRLGGVFFVEGAHATSTQRIRIQLGHRPFGVVDECIGFHSLESYAVVHVPLIVAGADFPNLTIPSRDVPTPRPQTSASQPNRRLTGALGTRH